MDIVDGERHSNRHKYHAHRPLQPWRPSGKGSVVTYADSLPRRLSEE